MIDLSPLFGSPDAHEGTSCLFRVFPKTGRERWMLDTSQRRPWHLKTWPRANLRAKVIYNTAWALGTVGVHLPARLERYDVAPGSLYAELQDQFEHLGIFLGTPGPNRKFVVYAGRGDESYFIKVPVSAVSTALVERETAALADLAKDPDLGPLVPHAHKIASHLALENIEGRGVGYGPLRLEELVRLHDMLVRRSETRRPLSVLRAEWQSEVPVGELVEHPQDVERAILTAQEAANHALDAISQHLDIPCYMAHGDFTRWNVLRAADGTARIIDWELYGLKPKWFDVLHYIVSHDLLVSRIPAGSIITRLSEVGRAICGTRPLREWWQQVILYFAYQCLYYGAVYARQSDLHPQVMWQLGIWTEILHNLPGASEKITKAEVVQA